MKNSKRLLKDGFELQNLEDINLDFIQIKKEPKTKSEIKTKINTSSVEREKDKNKKLF